MQTKSSSRLDILVPSVDSVARQLLDYCRKHDWSGYDPYDALNSPIFQRVPALNRYLPRLVLTQLLKRSPLNFRRLLAIPQTQNPKALALFLQASLKLSSLGLCDDETLVDSFIVRLHELRSTGSSYSCWGYSFPWQTRTLVVPRGSPNLVCTTFVANALFDAYEELGRADLLDTALSAAKYIAELYYLDTDGTSSFSYPLPGVPSKVHNANLLAAALIARSYRYTRDDAALERAMAVARYSTSRQQPDGSWYYGELPTQQWMDNFHTGYNLSALRTLGASLATKEFEPAVTRGFRFYQEHFIRPDGAARYFHNNTYPIDIHSTAQTILTLLEFSYLDTASFDVARRVYEWAMRHMWNENGFFYYRVLRTVKIRIPYMRWSEAWMLLALSTLAEREEAIRREKQERTREIALSPV